MEGRRRQPSTPGGAKLLQPGKLRDTALSSRASGGSGRPKASNTGDRGARRLALLAVARRLFASTSYDAITMAQVAREAGLAKGTPYLYFESKEELFLCLLDDMLAAWFESVDAVLDEERELTGERLVQIFVSATGSHDVLTRLLSLLGRVLEHNLTFEAAARYKRRTWTRMTHTAAKLEAKLPYLGKGGGFRLLMYVQVLIVGLREFADASPVVRKVIQEFELPGFAEFDFVAEFTTALDLYLSGLEQRAYRASREPATHR